jgi:hypothetical protein
LISGLISDLPHPGGHLLMQELRLLACEKHVVRGVFS